MSAQTRYWASGGFIVVDVDPNSKSKISSTPGAPSASAAPQWHLHIPPETYGPYSVQQLRDYARDGRMTAETLVWTEGNDAWARAGDQPSLKGLFPAAQSAPPPPQATAPRQAAALRAPDAAGAAPIGGRAGVTADMIATRSAASPRAASAGGAAPAGGRAMTFAESVRTCLKIKYAGFQGRARRSEYWWFALFSTILLTVVVTIAETLIFTTLKADGSISIVGMLAGAVAGLVWLAMIVPSLAVSIRRLHDLGWSGWWLLALLIPFVSIVMIIGFMMRGNDGPNKYGPDPLAPGQF
ncbi:MAG: DUF805 domain-containing protein [Roseiarcus sp.]